MPFDLTFRTPITIPSDIPEKDQWGGGPHQGGHKGDWTQAEGNDFSAHVGTPVSAAFDCIIMGQGWFPDLIDKEARAGKVYGLQMIVKNDDGKDSPDTDRVRAFYTHINKLEKGIAPGAVLKRGDPIGKIRSSSGAGVHLHFAMVERVGATWAKPRGIEIPGDFRKWALEASPADHVIRLFGDGTTDPVLDPPPPAPAQPQGGADSTPATGGSDPLSTPAANPDAGCNDAAVPQAVTSQADDGTTLDGGVVAVQRLSRTVAPAGLLQLQRSIGNRALAALLKDATDRRSRAVLGLATAADPAASARVASTIERCDRGLERPGTRDATGA